MLARTKLFKLILAGALALLFSASQGVACASDAYDRERELDAIRNALSGRGAVANRAKIVDLLDKASVPTKNLGIKGIRMQSDYRGEALKLLELARIPAKPERELAAIDAALKDEKDAEKRKSIQRLREEIERLWAKGDYREARTTVTKAVEASGAKVLYARC